MIECVENLIKTDSGIIKCPEDIEFYIELIDKIIVLVLFPSEIYEYTEKGFRNIFCYDKETGREIWQVESQEESPYVGLHLGIKKEEGDYEWQEIVEKGSIEKIEYTSELFRKDKDKVAAVTFNSHQYYIDIETGKVEWFGYTK